ncbi:protein-disulfide reductase DsbD family protein [Sinorhizobium sp. 7-81]|uniref:protein-disulfide reductase DsbD domain-containing protein n=1 Tax=Sinorhizobium sp. 8-89 TaxID=3049089 RepID=UPI0024C23B13|nr:protein-disulfide reductase DsbD domain-containing protein [Sinorhizobium sp. 8-89]MDK1488810.1 protein-disulfide reductase DsbD family protein [Sinorhizobium sp. 8-89]
MTKRPALEKMAQRIATASLLLLFFLPAKTYAAASDWVTSAGGTIRLVAAQPKADGTIPAILEVRLKPGWKTYWRNPGASGIPPQIAIDPSSGVVLEAIRFPAPQTFGEGPARYVGYDTPVAFPLVLKRTRDDGDLAIRASVFLGICEDICIPVQGELDLVLKKGEFDNPLDGARIADAVAALPQAPSADFKVTAARFDTEAGAIRLRLQLPPEASADRPDFFLAGPSGVSFGELVFGGETGAHRTADIPVKLSGKDKSIKGKPIALTVRAGSRSMETTLAFD